MPSLKVYFSILPNFRKTLEERVTGLQEFLASREREVEEVKQEAIRREQQFEREKASLRNELDEKNRALKEYQEKV